MTTKAERITSAQYMIKLGFRQRIVSQTTLLTSSQTRKLFDECERIGIAVNKHSGPKPSAAGIVRDRALIKEASLLMLCYTRCMTPESYQNSVDIIEFIRAYDEYITLRDRNIAFFINQSPIEISNGFVLAESLRNPDEETGGLLINCPSCTSKFYNATNQKLKRVECPWCDHQF
mgnify:CR=1 FL=1